MVEKSLYETVLGRFEGQGPRAGKPPRPSAAVVLWRMAEKTGKLEVYWIQRARTMPFMGGWHAFPGGGLSRRDVGADDGWPDPAGMTLGEGSSAVFPESLLDGLGDPGPNRVPGLLACALRELLEETGVLPIEALYRGEHGPASAVEASLAAARRYLLEERPTLAEALEREKLAVDSSRLTFAGRWLTPAMGPMRFDNRFFLLEWPRSLPVQPLVVPGEVEHGEWIDPAEGYDHWRRGKVQAAPPILHILNILGEEGPAAGTDRLCRPEEANLGPYRRVEFRPGVLMIPLATPTLPPASHTNAFLFGREERVLVDPGSGDPRAVERLVETAAALEAEGGRVSAIWLTHHHPDHVGGVAELRQRLGVPVAAHAETAAALEGRGIAVDRELRDGQRVVLEGARPFPVRVVHTPGHARGHLCFYDEEGGALLAGDMLSSVSTIVIDPPHGDMDDYLASLERLVELGPRFLFPSHGPPLADGVARLKELIQHRLWREEKLLGAWEQGLRTPDQLLPKVYDDVPEVAWPLAKRQIEAHLIRLRRAGKVGE